MSTMKPLAGLRVIEMAGLAPVPMCGMILADFGAKVIKIDRGRSPSAQSTNQFPGPVMDICGRGKRSIAVNLKAPAGVKVVQKLTSTADVLLEPFRPGVMERLGLGPSEVMGQNPRLIYARLTGYGQTGPFAQMAGHDINYLALSGMLSMFGRKHEKPCPPINFAADFAGGSLTCAFGILAALIARQQTGRGQVVDSSMVEGAAYVGSFLMTSRHIQPIWGQKRGENFLDGGTAFYDTYRTKDDQYMSVGALEPQFFEKLRTVLGFSEDEFPQFGDNEGIKQKLTDIFATKTQAEWCKLFDYTDACVAPVVPYQKVHEHPHNKARRSFLQGPHGNEPAPAPRLSETPASVESFECPEAGQHSEEVLLESGYTEAEVKGLLAEGVVHQLRTAKL